MLQHDTNGMVQDGCKMKCSEMALYTVLGSTLSGRGGLRATGEVRTPQPRNFRRSAVSGVAAAAIRNDSYSELG